MDKQIYSATYSNVPVFEYVTSEGSVMRRKLDSWINATHILKIARFPKAKRTRILEKDVQTGTHVKVQGGYGKYQGTYVPLEFGAEIAKNFGIYDILKPIFEFQYVEGRSQTPPPAPKHSHASASNVARKQVAAAAAAAAATSSGLGGAVAARKTKSMPAVSSGDPPRKRGRPKRVDTTLQSVASGVSHKPAVLSRTDTAPIKAEKGPSIGTFNNSRSNSLLGGRNGPISRQDTDQDALQLMVNSLNVQNDDLEVADKSSDDENHKNDIHRQVIVQHDTSLDDDENDELMTGNELFGSPRNSFEKIVQSHNSHINGGVPTSFTSPNDPYGLLQYHHSISHSNSLVEQPTISSAVVSATRTSSAIDKDAQQTNVYTEYFTTLLNFFLEDTNNSKIRTLAAASSSTPSTSLHSTAGPLPSSMTHLEDNTIPEHILNPPQPLAKIRIDQPVDNDGNSILHWACAMANTNMIEFLLEIFQDSLSATIKNNAGETPLMFLTRFSNSFQVKNFPTLLDLLFDSILSLDNNGRTVLHHIAQASSSNEIPKIDSNQTTNYKKNKEKFTRYYMETLFAKIIEFQEYQQNNLRSGRTELIAKVINHQDINGNTAFHIVAYNLNKKLIKVFISYHKYIDFTLKNLVSYTVEEYLASHNFVLRLGTNEIRDYKEIEQGNSEAISGPGNGKTPSFENQLHVSKAAVNSISSTTGLLNEKLVELAYSIDKELSERDNKLLIYYKLLNDLKMEKLSTQKYILKYFKLDQLLDDPEEEAAAVAGSNDEYHDKRDKIIQDEINRLVNDLSYEYLKRREELEVKMRKYKNIIGVIHKAKILKLKEVEGEFVKEQVEILDSPQERVKRSIELQQEIIKRRKLETKMVVQQLTVPVPVMEQEEQKENQIQQGEKGTSIVSRYSKDDKLSKYCKLISLCCGMNFNEVEKLIDLIEQSLAKSMSGNSMA